MPVLFGVAPSDLSPNFGDPRSGGRTHEGEDIMAVKGTPVVSPTDAVVTGTGKSGSPGIYVNTANPGGESFRYYHLDKIAPGIKAGVVLKPGDLIGFVGNTGNAAGGPTHLHFEVRKGRKALDPYSRLNGAFTAQQTIRSLQAIIKILQQQLADER